MGRLYIYLYLVDLFMVFMQVYSIIYQSPDPIGLSHRLISAPERERGGAPLGQRQPTRNARVFTHRSGEIHGDFSVGSFAGRSRQDLCGDRAEGFGEIWFEVESCICYHAISCNMHEYVYIYVDIYIFIMYHVLLYVWKIYRRVWCLQIGIPMSLAIWEVLASQDICTNEFIDVKQLKRILTTAHEVNWREIFQWKWRQIASWRKTPEV